MLAPVHILERLERRLPVAAAGPRDAPQRQRTLQATIDWSYDLLTREEQQLFSRLSVFAGGCTFAAAERVCGADLDTLHGLVDRSLIKTDGSRYWTLQTLREYALEKLASSGEQDQLRHRHAQCFVELLQVHTLEEKFLKMETETGRVLVGAERENFRAALEWTQQAGDFESMARLAVPLGWQWMEEGRLSEVDRWLNLVRERTQEYALPVQAGILSVARFLARQRGNVEEAVGLGDQALALYRELGDVRGIFWEMLTQASLSGVRGDLGGARVGIEEAVQFAHEQVPECVPDALGHLADLEIAAGRLGRARDCCEEALRLAPDTAAGPVVVALINLACIANLERRSQDASDLAQRAFFISLGAEFLEAGAVSALQLAWSLAHRVQPEATARTPGRRPWRLPARRSCDAANREGRRASSSRGPAQSQARCAEGLRLA